MMSHFRCMNHPDREAVYQCRQCGKVLCQECYDPALEGCREGRHALMPQVNTANQPIQPPPQSRDSSGMIVWKIVISLLAVTGGVTVLFLAICGAMIFSS